MTIPRKFRSAKRTIAYWQNMKTLCNLKYSREHVHKGTSLPTDENLFHRIYSCLAARFPGNIWEKVKLINKT